MQALKEIPENLVNRLIVHTKCVAEDKIPQIDITN